MAVDQKPPSMVLVDGALWWESLPEPQKARLRQARYDALLWVEWRAGRASIPPLQLWHEWRALGGRDRTVFCTYGSPPPGSVGA